MEHFFKLNYARTDPLMLRLIMSKLHRTGILFPLLLVLYEITLYLSNDMYLPALPDMMHDLDINATQAQLTITMWFLGGACTPLIMGALADRFGRRPTLLVGGVIYIITTILCAIAVDEYSLLIPRIIEGAMITSMMVAGYACIHEIYEHKQAIRVLAVMGSVSVLAPALGPLFGAFMLLYTSWRAIFWLIAISSTFFIVYLYYVMPETLAPEKRQSLHLREIVYNYWQVIANRQFLLLMATLGFLFAGFIGWVTTGPMLVISSFEYSKVAFGWMQAAVFASYILGSYTVNALMEKQYDAYYLVYVGVGIALISSLIQWAFAIIYPDQFMWFLAAMIIYSFGSALCFAPLNRLIIETSEQPMGIRVALFTTGLMGSGTLGSAITSFMYNGSSAYLAGFIAIGAVISSILLFIKIRI